MRRREFITLFGGAAAAPAFLHPRSAHAQQDGRVRRIGVLSSTNEEDLTNRAVLTALQQSLLQLGWVEGRNLRLEMRFSEANLDRQNANVDDLVNLAPDVIVVGGAAATRALQQRTRTIPIVFVSVGDPVASRVVASIARPEGNTTGITNLFPSIAGKWLELLRDAAPHVNTFALLFDPDFPVNEGYLAAIDAASAALAVKVIRLPVRNGEEVQRALDAFATSTNVGVIEVPPPLTRPHRELAARHAQALRLPVVSFDRFYVAAGFLMSYGANAPDLYRLAATYVDRILRGAKPSDLPVQFPTKFELVVNLKTAKAIGLTIPEAFLLRADEVIE